MLINDFIKRLIKSLWHDCAVNEKRLYFCGIVLHRRKISVSHSGIFEARVNLFKVGIYRIAKCGTTEPQSNSILNGKREKISIHHSVAMTMKGIHWIWSTYSTPYLWFNLNSNSNHNSWRSWKFPQTHTYAEPSSNSYVHLASDLCYWFTCYFFLDGKFFFLHKGQTKVRTWSDLYRLRSTVIIRIWMTLPTFSLVVIHCTHSKLWNPHLILHFLHNIGL